MGMFVPAQTYVKQCAPDARGLRRAFLAWGAGAVVLLVLGGLVLGAPLARAAGHEALAFTLYKSFAPLYHQIPERSFYFADHPLAVCARCAGLYAGLAAGVVFYPLFGSLRRRETPARAWLILAAVPTAIDFTLGFTGVWANTHVSRSLTGALLGAVMACYVVPGLVDMSYLSFRGLRGKGEARAS